MFGYEVPDFNVRYQDYQISSVGILVHTGPRLLKASEHWFLFVEQKDQIQETEEIQHGERRRIFAQPWGIPAGRVELEDSQPQDTALRELYEEVGIQTDQSALQLLIYNQSIKGQKIRPVYSCHVPMEVLQYLGPWEHMRKGVLILERGLGNSDEIGRLALIHKNELFRRSDPLIKAYYRWDSLHNVKSRLEGLWII